MIRTPVAIRMKMPILHSAVICVRSLVSLNVDIYAYKYCQRYTHCINDKIKLHTTKKARMPKCNLYKIHFPRYLSLNLMDSYIRRSAHCR